MFLLAILGAAIMIGVGLAWSLLTGLPALYDTDAGIESGVGAWALWGLIPIALGILAIWSA